MPALKKIVRSQRGQSIVELTLLLPLLIVMGLGIIETSNIINSYLVLTHMTREGANLTSRDTPADVGGLNCTAPNDALDVIIGAAGPVIDCNDPSRWRVIYSLIGPAVPAICVITPTPLVCDYVVQEQVVRGSGKVVSSKRVCPDCGLSSGPCLLASACPKPTTLSDVSDIAPGHTFYAVEVFYEYEPITPIAAFGVGLPTEPFYDRAVF
jgi:hypothetical protein